MDGSIHVSLFHRQIVTVSGDRALAVTRHRGGAVHSTVTCSGIGETTQKSTPVLELPLGMPQLSAAWSNVNSFDRALLMLTQAN